MRDRLFGCREVSLLIALSLCISSCTVSHGMSPSERAELIGQLQQARETDLMRAKDTELDPVQLGDYMTQAGKAETAIKDLSERSNVSESEISDALFVPPQHLSAAQRAELIKQLEQAKALDDQMWRNHQGGWDATFEQDCNVQAGRVDRVVNKLETDTPVSWSEIQDAMFIPDEAGYP